MIVCSCNCVTDREIRTALADAMPPLASAAKVYRAVGCQPKCGRCADTIRAIMAETGRCGGCALVVPALAEKRDAA